MEKKKKYIYTYTHTHPPIYIYIYIYIYHCITAAYLKLTHCKLTILQLKKRLTLLLGVPLWGGFIFKVKDSL